MRRYHPSISPERQKCASTSCELQQRRQGSPLSSSSPLASMAIAHLMCASLFRAQQERGGGKAKGVPPPPPPVLMPICVSFPLCSRPLPCKDSSSPYMFALYAAHARPNGLHAWDRCQHRRSSKSFVRRRKFETCWRFRSQVA